MKKISKICINCPAGCHLEITEKDDRKIIVEGNRCPRGEKYALQELSDPRRTVCAAVVVNAARRTCVPVKSSAPVPTAMINKLLKELYSMRLDLPVHSGDVIIKNFNGTNIDIIATGDCDG